MVDLGATGSPFRRYLEAGTKSHQKFHQNGGCEASLGLPWQAFGFTLLAQLSLGRLSLGFLPSFRLLYGKSWIFVYRHHSHTECYVLKVRAPKLEPLGQKSRARQVQSGLEVASQRGQDSQVLLVGAVLLSKLWTDRNPGAPHIKPEGKVY